MPGAIVQLAGSCNLANEGLDFTGQLLLDASLSETTSGMKAVLATIAQPLFQRKGGGSRIPIKIGGTWTKPTFGLDVKRVFGRRVTLVTRARVACSATSLRRYNPASP